MNPSLVVIGAGHAGTSCCAALRANGHAGSITLIGEEPHLPYHRPPLSKIQLKPDAPESPPLLRAETFFEKNKISLELGKHVIFIDPKSNLIHLESGKIAYDKLILATGSHPLLPPVNGLQQCRKHTIQKLSDVRQLKERLEQPRQILILGGGFIGLETAASLHQLGHTVTLFEREKRLLSRICCSTISTYFQSLHQQQGVTIHCDTEVTDVHELGEKIELTTALGERFTGDELIVGTGSSPNVELAEKAGLKLNNGIQVNPFNQTSHSDIFAIGDCCNQWNERYQLSLRLESVQNAVDQAKTVAANLCGHPIQHSAIPWFWTDQYDVKLQMAGLKHEVTHEIIRGTPTPGNAFSIWHFNQHRLQSVDAVNDARAYTVGKKIIEQELSISLDNIENPEFDLKQLVTNAGA